MPFYRLQVEGYPISGYFRGISEGSIQVAQGVKKLPQITSG